MRTYRIAYTLTGAMGLLPRDFDERVRTAIRHFWKTRKAQASSQRKRGRRDHGSRGAVTGGAQMDGFISLIAELIRSAGMDDAALYTKRHLEIPGFFRPTKEWDILVVNEGKLYAVVEAKSQVGSFGNNFNNRTEEAIGSAVDLWTAFREGAFSESIRPWLGYVFLLEDSPKSQSPVSVREPHFPVFKEFQGASYCKRYELLLRRLIRERHYEAAAFLTSNEKQGRTGDYTEPANDLAMREFARLLAAHIAAHVD